MACQRCYIYGVSINGGGGEIAAEEEQGAQSSVYSWKARIA